MAEAEDIAQNAYVKLSARAHELVNENLRSLLFITARNLAFDLHRRNRRQSQWIREFHEDAEQYSRIPHPAPGADRVLVAREHLQLVRQLLDELPPKCRHAFIAYKFEERDYGAIAEELGVSESMVRKYVLRAMAHCAKRFKELEGWV